MIENMMLLWFMRCKKAILADLKCKLPGLSTIIYFTDGCAGQYKNRKKFYNLCQHRSDFGLNARWVFFATSHGKLME